MWNWFKRSKSANTAPPEHPYYGARVSIHNQTIVLHRNNGDNQEFDKQSIIYIRARSVHPKKEGEYWVDITIGSGSNMSITSRADGFSDLEQWMFSLDGFNYTAYKTDQKSTSADYILLWEAPVTKNALLINETEATGFEKLQQGIQLENQDFLIPWGTFADLAEVSRVERSTISLPNPDYTQYAYSLHDVQLLNGLEVETLRAKTPSWAAPHQFNDDWPVTDYVSTVKLGESTEADFKRLKHHVSNHWGEPNYENQYPSSREACWNRGKNKIELRISTLADTDIYRPGCWVKISHEPDVDRFYTNDYQQGLQLHDQLHHSILNVKTDIGHSYVTEKKTRYTPSCFEKVLSSDACFVMWRDEKQDKLGFGNPDYCKIFDEHDISNLTIVHRYWRDDPSACSLYFNLNHTIDSNQQIATFKTNDIQQWQQIKRTINKITTKPIDCTEDRQYY
jgi:hypothetical protein